VGDTFLVRSYGQYCPVAKAAEVLGDRWTLLIVRDLLFGPVGFNELVRGLPGISRSVLSQRLRHLTRLGLVDYVNSTDQHEAGYQLTCPGRTLTDVVKVLGDWAAQWVLDDPVQAELDPDLLILWMSRHVRQEALPARPAVVAFDLTGPRPGRLWLVMEARGVSICHTDPGLDPSRYVYLTGRTDALYKVYLGRSELTDATAENQLALAGDPALIRALPDWFTWSAFAPTVRSTMTARHTQPA
jgi:DNA-binding HxlR family transcriptional regulator